MHRIAIILLASIVAVKKNATQLPHGNPILTPPEIVTFPMPSDIASERDIGNEN
jgi:hypothetical protein